MSTQPPVRRRERFRLDESRFSAHVIADDEHFGIRADDKRGFAPAIVTCFEDAIQAKAILGSEGIEPKVFAVGADALVVAVRASRETAAVFPLCQVATHAFEPAAIAFGGDESFGECCRVIAVLLDFADDLVVPFAILSRTLQALQLPVS
jgi:hypothetical protein